MHECLMRNTETAMDMFYDTALLRVAEEIIVNQFYENLIGRGTSLSTKVLPIKTGFWRLI